MRPFSSCRNTEASLVELTGIDVDRRTRKRGKKALLHNLQSENVQTVV